MYTAYPPFWIIMFAQPIRTYCCTLFATPWLMKSLTIVSSIILQKQFSPGWKPSRLVFKFIYMSLCRTNKVTLRLHVDLHFPYYFNGPIRIALMKDVRLATIFCLQRSPQNWLYGSLTRVAFHSRFHMNNKCRSMSICCGTLHAEHEWATNCSFVIYSKYRKWASTRA